MVKDIIIIYLYMSNPCTDPTSAIVYNILSQKRQRALYNVPVMRLNLISPYPNYTKNQLDMRRKTEILKYQSQSTQTNNLSKAQRWAQMANGNYTSNISQFHIENNTNTICSSDALIPTLTTACDVPGPPIYLTYDPAVPLYMYNKNTNSLAIVNNYGSTFQLYSQTQDLLLLQQPSYSFSNNYVQYAENSIGVITIPDTVVNKDSTYDIQVPVTIWCRGIYVGNSTDSNVTYRPYIDPIRISVASVALNIYYNNILLTTVPISSQYNGIDSSYNLTSLVIDPNLTDPQIFLAIQYVGMLTVPSFILSTQYGNVFNLSLSFNYNFTNTITNQPYKFIDSIGNTVINAFEAGIYCNISSDYNNIYVNPSSVTNNHAVLSVPSTAPFSMGSFNQLS